MTGREMLEYLSSLSETQLMLPIVITLPDYNAVIESVEYNQDTIDIVSQELPHCETCEYFIAYTMGEEE